MSESNAKYEMLARKEIFNASVRHIQGSIGLIDNFASKKNLVDTINTLLLDKTIAPDQISAIISLILIDKFKYIPVSHNFQTPVEDIGSVFSEVVRWNAVDIAVVYHHPDVGIVAINPKNLANAELIDKIRKNEFAVIYVGSYAKPVNQKIADLAAQCLIKLLEGEKFTTPKELLKGDCVYRQAKKEKAISPKKTVTKSTIKKSVKSGKKTVKKQEEPEVEIPPAKQAIVQQRIEQASKAPARMTPQYSVPVTNELFHNGNVEAWKKIIASYKMKYPNLEVYVYYDGERIININSLFKWGKVKHGSTIQFAVAGDEIKDVAKLQRYLMQGASHGFEAFLKGSINSVLNLF